MALRVIPENLSSIGPEIDFLKSNKVLEKNYWMHCRTECKTSLLAAFFAFFCLSVLNTLRLDRTWSLIMMQSGKTIAKAEADSFLIFSVLRILPMRFRTAENTSNLPHAVHFEFP